MTEKIVVLGASGQVGRAWAALPNMLAYTKEQVDLADPRFIAALEKQIGSTPVAAVVNAAAYTNVRQAESEEALAMRINAEAVRELATWCKVRGIALLHYSTDYVFGDEDTKPHRETDATAPLNAYGRSKLAGEQAIENIGGKTLIFRTSWVYDEVGKNFFNTMLELFAKNETLPVVADQFGAPTYAPDLVSVSQKALNTALTEDLFPSGIYHLCNSGETSWQGFAQAILTLARKRISGLICQQVNPIPTRERADPVKRPLNSRLDCTKAKRTFGVTMPSWEKGLRQCIEKKYEHSGLQHSRPQARTF